MERMPGSPVPVKSRDCEYLRAVVFHVRPSEHRVLERALKKFGTVRRRRGASLASACRAALHGRVRR